MNKSEQRFLIEDLHENPFRNVILISLKNLKPTSKLPSAIVTFDLNKVEDTKRLEELCKLCGHSDIKLGNNILVGQRELNLKGKEFSFIPKV